MKKLATTTLAAFALAAILPHSAVAADPVNPVPGAFCNLYPDQSVDDIQSLSEKPAAATFIDTVADFKASDRKQGLHTSLGMWTGYMKIERGATYTFVSTAPGNGSWYSIWINGKECISGWDQHVFNVDLAVGFNLVTIYTKYGPLTLTYRRVGSLKEPVAFGPKDMFHEDVEEDD